MVALLRRTLRLLSISGRKARAIARRFFKVVATVLTGALKNYAAEDSVELAVVLAERSVKQSRRSGVCSVLGEGVVVLATELAGASPQSCLCDVTVGEAAVLADVLVEDKPQSSRCSVIEGDAVVLAEVSVEEIPQSSKCSGIAYDAVVLAEVLVEVTPQSDKCSGIVGKMSEVGFGADNTCIVSASGEVCKGSGAALCSMFETNGGVAPLLEQKGLTIHLDKVLGVGAIGVVFAGSEVSAVKVMSCATPQLEKVAMREVQLMITLRSLYPYVVVGSAYGWLQIDLHAFGYQCNLLDEEGLHITGTQKCVGVVMQRGLRSLRDAISMGQYDCESELDMVGILGTFIRIIECLIHLLKYGFLMVDLKPDNIMEMQDGWKLADVGGIYRLDVNGAFTFSALSEIIYTPGYLPRKDLDSRCLTVQSSVYAVGQMLEDILIAAREDCRSVMGTEDYKWCRREVINKCKRVMPADRPTLEEVQALLMTRLQDALDRSTGFESD